MFKTDSKSINTQKINEELLAATGKGKFLREPAFTTLWDVL